ncbi:YsnF/AvaK domain-containing protein [Pontibacter locisalis]|uniref:YsnF/AvaK domain-containing protein n=1 Tax=Pontibacter locisalis TaxID=1719035 RepID=A0ABW5IQF1_9BACT
MSHTVVGVFETSNEAQTALQQLVNSGFERDNIDIAPQAASKATDHDKDNDSIGSFFRNLFGSDDRSKHYSDYARTGAIVTVHAKSAQEADRAAGILDRNGAVDLDERTSGPVTGKETTGRDTASTGTTIPVIEEEMQVGKRSMETGGVRVRSRIIERPVEEHLRLREEHVRVERRPVDRPATDRDINSFKEGDIEMKEHAEVPIVNKEARVVEEVNVSKGVEEHEENIRDTVRKTDVEVDKFTEEELKRRREGGDRPNNV